jgi:hypothetical protein
MSQIVRLMRNRYAIATPATHQNTIDSISRLNSFMQGSLRERQVV